MNLIKHLIVGTIIFSIVNSSTKAETLDFNSVLDKAIENSFDLKISQFDVDISKAGIKEVRSEYFPVLSANFYNSYDRNLDDKTSGINSVGDTVLLGTTRYQNAFSLALQYNLYDFGIRGKKLFIAKQEKTQKEIEYKRNLRNLKIEIVDLYTKALLANKELLYSRDLLFLNKNLFSMYENLDVAGTVRKTEVTDQALKVARLINKIDDLKTDLKNTLEDISSKTQDKYSLEDLEILYVYAKPEVQDENDNIEPVSDVIKLDVEQNRLLNPEELPEYEAYQLEIEKKKAELSILKRQRLPQIRFTSSYYFYGSDKNDFFDTFEDFEQRNLSFKIATTLPVFDGLKNKAQREKAKLEIEKLKLQRDKQVERIKNYYEKVYVEANDFSEKCKNQENSLELVKKKLEMLEKLNEQKLIDKITYLTQKSDLINQELELEKLKINNEANKYKLTVLEE